MGAVSSLDFLDVICEELGTKTFTNAQFIAKAKELGYVAVGSEEEGILYYTQLFGKTIGTGAGTELAVVDTEVAPVLMEVTASAETGLTTVEASGLASYVSYAPMLCEALLLIGTEIKGLEIGQNIADYLEEVDPGFWYDFYSQFGDAPMILANGITYIDETLAEKINQFFQDKGVYDGKITTQNITSDYQDAQTGVDASALATGQVTVGHTYTSKDVSDMYSHLTTMIEETPILTAFEGVGKWGSSNSVLSCDFTYFYTTSPNPPALQVKTTNNSSVVSVPMGTTLPSGTEYRYEIRNLTGDLWQKHVRVIHRLLTGKYELEVWGNAQAGGVTVNSASIGNKGWALGLASVGLGVAGITMKYGSKQPAKGQSLKDAYPDWYARRRPFNTVSPTGENLLHNFVPFPTSDIFTDPTQEEAQNPHATDEEVQKKAEDMIDKIGDDGGDVPTTPPQKPSVPTPPIAPLPLVPSTGMHKIYAPTTEQVISFNNFLWSTDFYDTITKILQDPMDAVISFHRLYTSVQNPLQATIVLGRVDSGVVSQYTTKQYIELDCGTVSLYEFYKNATDYDGFTDIQIYLPFIGFRTLSAHDVINGTVNVKYNIDILTGNCVANIFVKQNNNTQCLYTFNGNCAEHVPLTGSNYTSLITSSLALAGAVGGTIASGGMLAPTVIGGASSLAGGLGHTVQRSGSLDGNFGALAIKKPYIVITRKVGYDAYNYNNLYGYPANKTIRLGNCKGYTKVKDVHVENIVCTDEEKNLIETLLKQGVIV